MNSSWKAFKELFIKSLFCVENVVWDAQVSFVENKWLFVLNLLTVIL